MIRFHANCVPVHGAMRTLLYDLQFGGALELPRDFAAALAVGIDVDGIEASFGEEGLQLAAVLMSRGLCVDDCGEFPAIADAWAVPAAPDHAILDCTADTRYDPASVLAQLVSVGVRHVLARVGSARPEWIAALESACATLRITVDWWLDGSNRGHGPAGDRILWFGGTDLPGHRSDGPLDLSAPTLAHADGFHFSVEVFHRAQTQHPYFAGKVYIDAEGRVGNGPGGESFADVCEDGWTQVLGTAAFRRRWTTRADDRPICCDCEFRYACLDHRQDDRACPFDPYTGAWSENGGPRETRRRD